MARFSPHHSILASKVLFIPLPLILIYNKGRKICGLVYGVSSCPLQTILNYSSTNIAVFKLMLRATSVSFFYAYEIHGFTPEEVR